MWDGLSPPSQVCSLTEKLVLCVHKVFHSLEKMGEKSVYELSLLSRSVFIFLCPLITFMLQGYSCISSFFIFLVAKMCPDMLLHLILLFLLVWWWNGLFFFFFSPLRNGFSQCENTDLLRSALQVLADRLKPGETEFLVLEELIRYNQYFQSSERDFKQFSLFFMVIMGKWVFGSCHRENTTFRELCI